MSYTEQDAAMDEFYEQISNELYADHKEQAIGEFTDEKLRSFYQYHPDVMRPAVDAIREGNWLLEHQRFPASVVFYVSAVEILLKATLLRPVLYGLIHNEGLAEIMTNHILGQSGIQRYEKLLAQLFDKLCGIDVTQISREHAATNLFTECRQLQTMRNGIVHRGASCTKEDADRAHLVAVAVFDNIVQPMLDSIGLTVIKNGAIVQEQ